MIDKAISNDFVIPTNKSWIIYFSADRR